MEIISDHVQLQFFTYPSRLFKEILKVRSCTRKHMQISRIRFLEFGHTEAFRLFAVTENLLLGPRRYTDNFSLVSTVVPQTPNEGSTTQVLPCVESIIPKIPVKVVRVG